MSNKMIGFTFSVILLAAVIAFFAGGGLDQQGNGEKTTRLPQLQSALAVQGVELGEEDTVRTYYKLNGQRPRTFELANGEFLSVYEYRSENARRKGESDFEEIRARADMQIPEAYVVRNVLLHYWYAGQADLPTEFADRIETAVVSLGGERTTK
ncbi:hypothetical protein [Paenibacillus soyae]|uniref:Uncharacterized protein n=1 Tax=Paenibacillus soyae TaxID=2969249 RepID=A0A9X2N1C6_9BACL|nr:hypothetical protein [Paenibacillus soyae]MCR2807297.1 hypothetical protein [Paenibacillus soyae]